MDGVNCHHDMSDIYLPIVQSEIRVVNGSPEGILPAEVGEIVVNGVTGDLYIKKTRIEFATGWKKFLVEGEAALSGTTIIGIGNPEGVQLAGKGAWYWDEPNDILYFKTTDSSMKTGWKEKIA